MKDAPKVLHEATGGCVASPAAAKKQQQAKAVVNTDTTRSTVSVQRAESQSASIL